MKPGDKNSYNSLKSININGSDFKYFSLQEAEKNGLKGISKLPKSLKVLLENLLRYEDDLSVTKNQIESIKNWIPYKHTVMVDKGLRFGVSVGQPVFDNFGVVGQVIRSMPLNSEVIMITDPGHAIPVTNNRNNIRTIAIGSGQSNQLSLPFLPNNADIKPGDLLVTSGLGGKFPSGYPVAIIDKVTTQPDKPFLKITATPSAHLNRSHELLIVWSDNTPVALDPQIDQLTLINSIDNVSN